MRTYRPGFVPDDQSQLVEFLRREFRSIEQSANQITAPAFSAYQNSAQAIPATTLTKLNMQAEEFDTDSAFNVSNSRFTPQVPGYYLITVSVTAATPPIYLYVYIYKNGTAVKVQGDSSTDSNTVTALVEMNGTTDYVEPWCYFGTAMNAVATAKQTYFQGHMARAK